MFDREALFKIQDEEETAFKNLPEEIQKRAISNVKGNEMSTEGEATEEVFANDLNEPFELPPLLSEERHAEKIRLLQEGFSQWKRLDYNLFVKGSATYGRDAYDKIALEVGRPENEVIEFATAFWGELGKSRIAEHEYDRVSKLVERGEKKIDETKNLERATAVLVSHFDNPWEELEFTYVNCKDKMFTAEEDRHLLCWSRKVWNVHIFSRYLLFMYDLTFHFSLISMAMVNGWPLSLQFEETQLFDLITFFEAFLLTSWGGDASNS